MKQPYVKEAGSIGKYTIYVVDGGYIRKNMDGMRDFTNFAHHGRFKQIPSRELWLDKGFNPEEGMYFLDNLLKEASLMDSGKSFGEAHSAAVAYERRERIKARNGNRVRVKKDPESVPKKHLPEYDKDGLSVYLVDGKFVRDNLYIDFTEGGNDKAYSFIPDKCVWIDDSSDPKEIKFFVAHEIKERELMDKGMSYIRAHRKATEVEHELRNQED